MIQQARRTLLPVCLAAAIAELLFLRVALRLGPVLPAQGDVLMLFGVVQAVGVTALNLAVLCALGLLAATVAGLDRRRPLDVLLGILLTLAALVNVGLSFLVDWLPETVPAAIQGGVTGLAALLLVARAERPARTRVVLGLVAVAQALALSPGLGGAGWLGRGIVAAEAVAVLAALVLPLVVPVRPGRRASIGGAVVGLALALAGLVQPWGLATVAIWTLGFTYYLPSVVYGLAAASVVAFGPALWRAPDGRHVAAGLLLVALAGLKLDVTAWALLGLAGLAVAAWPADAPARERAPDARDRLASLAARPATPAAPPA